MYRINAFDWEDEFTDIMKSGGFDAVIGNPPYGIPFSREELTYLSECYRQAQKFLDSYCLFMVKGLRLIPINGFLSFIVPNTFCDLESCSHFRLWLLSENGVDQIWQSGWAFKSAVVDTLVFVAREVSPERDSVLRIRIQGRDYLRTVSSFLANHLHKIDYRNTDEDRHLLSKVLQRNVLLGELVTVKAGVKLYEKGKGQPPQTKEMIEKRPYTTNLEQPDGWRILYRGKHVNRYKLEKINEFVNYGPWLAAQRTPDLFESPKILMRRTDDRLRACLETKSAIAVNSCHIISLKKDFETVARF